jgi:mono/diheme cytochrome c family protein
MFYFMSKSTLKRIAIVAAIVIAAPVVYLAKAYVSTNSRINQSYEVKNYPVNVPNDSTTLALGAHLIKIKGCTDCHGADLSGRIFIDDPKLVMLPATNLTRGKGGLPNDYRLEDWVRALRHGINREGRSLYIMPSNEYMSLTEKDLGAIIAYCEQLPPVDNELPEKKLGLLGRVLTDLNKLDLLVAEHINHEQPLVHDIEVEVSEAYGEYLAVSCTGCHRPNLKGGGPLAPGFPSVPDISSSSRVSQWNEEQFFALMRTGVNPDGKQIPNEEMPWQMTQHYTDVEIKALLTYLKKI